MTPYEEGARAARDPDADKRCPYVTETSEADEWWLGFTSPEWQPIETAPKSRVIWLRYPTMSPPQRKGQWFDVGNGRAGWMFGNRFWDEQPTGWADVEPGK